MAHLGNTIINGVMRIIGGLYTNTINGVTVGDNPKFTDTNTTYDVFTDSANGLVPAASSANKTDAESSVGNYYLCADKKFRKLPANAFKNDNTNTTYTFTGGTNQFTVTPSTGSATTVAVTPSWTINASTGENADSVGAPSVSASTSGTTTTFTFNYLKGASGTRGSRISFGTAITGTSTTATAFSGSGITDALVNDEYINTSTWNVYKCTVAGNAAAAKWVYVGTMTTTAANITGTAAYATNLGTSSANYTKSSLDTAFNGKASSTHTHGNITNAGALQDNDITIASGDKLVVTNADDSSKIARASISFDGSTATQALTRKGTWETFNNYSHPTGNGNNHIPPGGLSGQFLKYSSAGTAAWSAITKPTSVVCTTGTDSTTTGTPKTGDGETTYYRFKDTDSNWLSGALQVKNGSKGSTGNAVTTMVCVTANGGTTAGTPKTGDGETTYYRFKDSAGNWISGTVAVKNGSSSTSSLPTGYVTGVFNTSSSTLTLTIH